MNNLSRTEKRKLETRNQIKSTTIEFLVNNNSSDMKLEKIAIMADVSRKTIYNHFANKEELLSEIINPILEFCIEAIKKVSIKKDILIEDISFLCLTIYKEFGQHLNLMYNIDFKDLNQSTDLHKAYTMEFIRLFERITDFKYNKISPRKAAIIVFKTFVPLLNSISDIDSYEEMFINSLTGMIKGLE